MSESTGLRIGIVGAGGRMGRMLIETTLKDGAARLAGAFEVLGSPFVGRPVGELVGMPCDLKVSDDLNG